MTSHCQQSSPTPVTMALHYFGIYVWYGVLLRVIVQEGTG